MGKISNDYSCSIFGWMVNLGMPREDTFVFAAIYQATQGTQATVFDHEFLAEFADTTVEEVEAIITRLIRRGLLVRHEYSDNGVIVQAYTAFSEPRGGRK